MSSIKFLGNVKRECLLFHYKNPFSQLISLGDHRYCAIFPAPQRSSIEYLWLSFCCRVWRSVVLVNYCLVCSSEPSQCRGRCYSSSCSRNRDCCGRRCCGCEVLVRKGYWNHRWNSVFGVCGYYGSRDLLNQYIAAEFPHRMTVASPKLRVVVHQHSSNSQESNRFFIF